MSRIYDCISELQKLLDISFSADTLSDHAGSHYQTIADIPLDSFTDLIREAITLLMAKESSVITYPETRNMLKLDDVFRVIGEEVITDGQQTDI